MNESASQLISQIAAGVADRLDEMTEVGEAPIAALVCVWTVKGEFSRILYHVGTSGRDATREETLELLAALQRTVSEVETRGVGTIG